MADKREGLSEESQWPTYLRAKTSSDDTDRRAEDSQPITGTPDISNPDKFRLDVNSEGMKITSGGGTNPVAPAVPDTEFSIVVPKGTKFYFLKTRKLARLKVAFAPFGVGVPYSTIPLGGYWAIPVFHTAPVTLYLKCDKPSAIIEFTTWS